MKITTATIGLLLLTGITLPILSRIFSYNVFTSNKPIDFGSYNSRAESANSNSGSGGISGGK